jgi:hypothetical protein
LCWQRRRRQLWWGALAIAIAVAVAAAAVLAMLAAVTVHAVIAIVVTVVAVVTVALSLHCHRRQRRQQRAWRPTATAAAVIAAIDKGGERTRHGPLLLPPLTHCRRIPKEDWDHLGVSGGNSPPPPSSSLPSPCNDRQCGGWRISAQPT